MADNWEKIDPAWAWRPFEPDGKRPWNRARAAHLFRRAALGASSAQLDQAVKGDPAAAVKSLLAGPETDEFARQMDQLAKTMLATGNPQSLSAWWLYRMLHTPHPLLEKMTLFWHGHFATSADKVRKPRAMLVQNEMLRRHALGDFGKMVQGIARDPAMLIYLDSTTNRKIHPNENYARELMELFCLGVGNYTEKDIRELARCFTGWELRGDEFRFNKFQHDYGKKTILGRSGDFDGDEATRVVLDQPAAPRFIVGKLLRYLVCDEPEFPPALIAPLAKQLRGDDFNVRPLVAGILGSQLFFSEQAMGRKVRSPVELAVGLLRSLEATTNVQRLAEDLGRLGQAVLYPPNVKGWDGGRTWINSSTVLGRANLVHRLMHGGETRFAGGTLEGLAERHGITKPDETVEWLLGLLVAVSVPDGAKQSLLAVAGSGGESRAAQIGNVVHAISTLPEFQLG